MDKEPKAPEGFVYKTEVRLSETTNKMEVVRRLKPIKDNHGPMNGEPKLTDDLEYETCEDIDSKPTYNVDGQRVLKFIRRIVKKNSSKPQDKEDQAPEGYVYETVLKVDKKTTKVTEKPVPLVPTDGVKIYNTTTTIVTTEESKTPMPIQPVITTTTTSTTTSKTTQETRDVVRPQEPSKTTVNKTVTSQTTIIKEPSPYPNEVPSIVTKEVSEFIQKTTKTVENVKPVYTTIGNMTVVSKRVLQKIDTEEDSNPIDDEPQAPVGYKYKSSIEQVEVNNKTVVKLIRRLVPIKDDPQPNGDEEVLAEGYEYETVEDKESPPEYNSKGEKIIKFIRRIVKKFSSTKRLTGEEEPPAGYFYREVEQIVKKTSTYTPKPVAVKLPPKLQPTIIPAKEVEEDDEQIERSKKYMKVIKTQIKVNKFGLCSQEGKLIFSSILNKTFRNYRINSTNGWRAKNNQSGEWVGLQFMEPFEVSQVQIAATDDGAYPSEFHVEYSEDGSNFVAIPKKIVVKKMPTKAITLEFSSVKCIAIRIKIDKFVKWPAGKFEFLYTDEYCTSDVDEAEDYDNDGKYDYDSKIVLSKNKRTNDSDKDYIRSMKIIQVEGGKNLDFAKLKKDTIKDGLVRASETGVISYSSVEQDDGTGFGLEGQAWRAESNSSDEYVGYIFPSSVTVTEIMIIKTESGEYPTTVDIQYSEDFHTYKSLEKPFELVFGENGVAKITIPEVKCA